MVNKELLIKAGLSQREIECYLTLAKLKESKAGELSKITGEQRTNTYDTLNSLIKRNLINFVIKNNKKIFFINSPNKLMEFLEEKKKEINELEKDFRGLISEIKIIQEIQLEKPIIEVYEGVEGMRTVFMQSLRETLKLKKEIIAIGAHQQLCKELDPIFYERFYKEREKYKIKSRYIITEDVKPIYIKLAISKILPKNYKSPTATYIYGNKVSFWFFAPKLTIIVIENKTLTESYRNYFELLWKQAKKI